jgi:hypothetical protein
MMAATSAMTGKTVRFIEVLVMMLVPWPLACRYYTALACKVAIARRRADDRNPQTAYFAVANAKSNRRTSGPAFLASSRQAVAGTNNKLRVVAAGPANHFGDSAETLTWSPKSARSSSISK